jgi:hypothetical protein
LKWGKEGLTLDIINRTLQEKVNIISKGSNELDKHIDGKFIKNKKKEGRFEMADKIRDNSLIISEVRTDHLSKVDKRFDKIGDIDK